jgi:hypothetical protein
MMVKYLFSTYKLKKERYKTIFKLNILNNNMAFLGEADRMSYFDKIFNGICVTNNDKTFVLNQRIWQNDKKAQKSKKKMIMD